MVLASPEMRAVLDCLEAAEPAASGLEYSTRWHESTK